jgi:hypothetical protein
MKLILGVVADAANRSFGDKLNILGVFHSIGSESFPVTQPSLALALEWRASPLDKGRDFQWGVRLLGPDAQTILEIGGELSIHRDAPALSPIVPMDLNLNNIVFPVEGSYRFEISIDKEVKGDIPLDLVLIKAQQSAP